MLRLRLRLITSLSLIVVTGCDSAGPDVVSVEGRWTGAATLPNGRTATADLQQSGTTVGGTLRISGVFNATDFTGNIDDLGRLAWSPRSGCELWSGILTVNETEDRMEGSINLDAGSCPDTRGASGTLRLERSSD